jgi:hypothetical protein
MPENPTEEDTLANVTAILFGIFLFVAGGVIFASTL